MLNYKLYFFNVNIFNQRRYNILASTKTVYLNDNLSSNYTKALNLAP